MRTGREQCGQHPQPPYRLEDKVAVLWLAARGQQREAMQAFGCSAASVRRWRSDSRIVAKLESAQGEPGRLVQFLKNIGPDGSWLVNTYWKCFHSCIYCIAHNQGPTRVWNAPPSVLSTLRQSLSTVPVNMELQVGACSDPYPPIEQHLGLTRAVLTELKRQKRPICILTKSSLVTRDIDILRDYEAHCDVYVTIGTLDDSVSQRLEPGAPPPSERLKAVRALSEAGIDVVYVCNPWMPKTTDVEAAYSAKPREARMKVSRLTVSHAPDSSVLEHKYTQEEIDERYAEARRLFGERDGVEWE